MKPEDLNQKVKTAHYKHEEFRKTLRPHSYLSGAVLDETQRLKDLVEDINGIFQGTQPDDLPRVFLEDIQIKDGVVLEGMHFNFGLKFRAYGALKFKDCRFSGSVSIECDQKAEFDGCTFGKVAADADKTRISTVAKKKLSFNKTSFLNCTHHFEAAEEVVFSQSNFEIYTIEPQPDKQIFCKETAFKRCSFNPFRIYKTTFDGKVLFEDCQSQSAFDANMCSFQRGLVFKNCDFSRAPSLFDAVIHGETTIFDESCKFRSRLNSDSKRYAAIARLYDNKDEVRMREFHALELMSELNGKCYEKAWGLSSKAFYRKVINFVFVYVLGWRGVFSRYGFFNYLYLWINRYGTSLWRPLICLLFLAVLFYCLVTYTSHGAYIPEQNCSEPAREWVRALCTTSPVWERNLIYVFHNVLWPFKLVYAEGVFEEKTPWLHTMRILFSLLSTLLIVMFGVGLRQRFKVKV